MPVVLDADGLWELEPFERAATTVMTPHAGELARLLGTEAAEIDAHRLEAVRRAASRFGATVLLKGADTLVASPREGVLVSAFGAPSLATAGTGDVLAGVIAAFLAKGHGAAARRERRCRCPRARLAARRARRPGSSRATSSRDPARARRRGLGTEPLSSSADRL